MVRRIELLDWSAGYPNSLIELSLLYGNIRRHWRQISWLFERRILNGCAQNPALIVVDEDNPVMDVIAATRLNG